MISTDKLLDKYTSLLNKYGPYSERAQAFLDANNDNEEFLDLAGVVRELKLSMDRRARVDQSSSRAWG